MVGIFWINSLGLDVIEKIQCAHKHVAHAFRRLFDMEFGTVESEEHAFELFNNCIKVQTHDCEKGHCLKKVRMNQRRDEQR